MQALEQQTLARTPISGIFPDLCLKADLGPPRSECGVGAMMAWADRLWVVTYLSNRAKSGSGTGLYEIDANLQMKKRPEGRAGTYTNRMIHCPSNTLFIGPHQIDAAGNVRTIEALVDVRVCSTMRHLTDPDNKVYMLGMEGEFFETDVRTLETKQLFDLTRELGVRYPHFKAGYCEFGRVVVTNNSYLEDDFLGKEALGRLAEWDGTAWKILERAPFVEATGRGTFGGTIFATGWDRASAILKVFTKSDGQWKRYRLPKASHCFDQAWQTEWPRIREVDHERFLMDCHGMFYELSPWAYGGQVWGVRPISTHLWVLGDFCSYRGMLVLGADNASPTYKFNHLSGEPQSGLWFGKTDDLWQFGAPKGWGGPWWEDQVQAGVPSDPYLMTGFDQKCLHLSHEGGAPVTFSVEVDPQGNGRWKEYARIEVAARGYAHHEFPVGFSAHWVRVTANKACVATATFHYT